LLLAYCVLSTYKRVIFKVLDLDVTCHQTTLNPSAFGRQEFVKSG